MKNTGPGEIKNILSSDILIADVIVSMEGNEELRELVRKYNLKPGSKSALTKEQFEEFSAAVAGHPVTIMPGGSSANVLTTLGKLMNGDNLQTDFLGVVGHDMYSNMIRDSFADTNIRLKPESLPRTHSPESAVSYVILFPNGERAIATYPGNARDILDAEMVTAMDVKKADVLLIQGSLWQKFGEELPNELMKKRWEEGKELWLALPTHAKFGEEKAGLFQWLSSSANLVLGNGEELARMCQVGSEEEALHKLQEIFQERCLERERANGTWHGNTHQIGFITLGKKGAAVVTTDSIEYVPPARISEKEIVNTLGAGDTSFAGFAYGYLKGLSPVASAEIAMALASEKLKHNGPRLHDPASSLRKAMPNLTSLLAESHDRAAAIGQ